MVIPKHVFFLFPPFNYKFTCLCLQYTIYSYISPASYMHKRQVIDIISLFKNTKSNK